MEGCFPDQTFVDALGRVTNTVRAVWCNGSRDPAYAPLVTRTEYPYGTDGYSVTIDPFGVQTVTRTYYENNAKVTEAAFAGVTNRTAVTWGGDTVTEKFCDGKWTRETRSTAHGAAGCRIETVTAEASDIPAPVVTSETMYDFLGRAVSFTMPLGVTSNFYDGALDRVIRVSRTGSPDTFYVYDALGELTATAIDVDGNGQVSATDRVSSSVTSYDADVSNVWWRVTAQAQFVGGVTNGLALTKEQLTGLSNAHQSCIVMVDADGVATTETVAFDPVTHVTAATTANSLQATPAVRVSKYGYDLEAQNLDRRAANTYDGFARAVTQTEATEAGFTNSVQHISYDAYGLAVTNRSVYGADEAVTAAAFDSLGREVSRTDALGNAAYSGYDALNQVIALSGATYPVGYGYDTQGRRVSMKTFRDENGAGDETRWLYDDASGLLTNKVYADGSSVRYGYTSEGRLLSRTWARGTVMTNNYDSLGQITRIDYSGRMFDVFHTYDAFGRALASSNSSARYEYRNSLSGSVTNESVTVGTNACALTRSLDAHARLVGLTVDGSEAVFGYDEENRLTSVSHPEAAAEYRYANGFVAGYTLTLTNGNAVERLVGRDPHRQELVATVSNLFNGTLISGSDYGHDLLGRRERRTDTTPVLSVTNLFGYNQRSEVTSAMFGTDTYGYGYDSIGNRLFSAFGIVTNTYSANALNQYAGLSYDADGNLLSTGGYRLTWDCENRLQTMRPLAATNGSLRVENRYVHRHRRVTKQVYELSRYTPPSGEPPMPGNPGEWSLVKTHTYFYDGWNLVLETVAHTNGVTERIEYVWGLDLSGTMQGAGGVGGLLFEKRNGQIFVPFYDANGNIVTYVDEFGETVAQREYDVFGNTVSATGPMANDFNFWFSTKYLDHETGFYYYGYRFYSPELQRFISRDPIEERGGTHLYGFVGNDSVNKWDYLGLETITVPKCHAYLILGHTKKKDPIHWKFTDGCAYGGVVGCWPSKNNPSGECRWPNIPIHDNKIFSGGWLADLFEGQSHQGDIFDENYREKDWEHDFKNAVDNALSSSTLSEIASKLCGKSCCCEKITVVILVTKGGEEVERGVKPYGLKLDQVDVRRISCPRRK